MAVALDLCRDSFVGVPNKVLYSVAGEASPKLAVWIASRAILLPRVR